MTKDTLRKLKNGVFWVLSFAAALIVSNWLTNFIYPIWRTGQPLIGETANKEFEHRWTVNQWVGMLMLLSVWSAMVAAQKWWQRWAAGKPAEEHRIETK